MHHQTRFSKAAILAILDEFDSGQTPSVAALCRKHGISRQAYYYWRAKYGSPQAAPVRELEGRLHRMERAIADLREQIEEQLEQITQLERAARRPQPASAYDARRAVCQ